MNKCLSLAICSVLLYSATFAQSSQVRLHGSMKELGASPVIMKFTGASGDIGKNKDVPIPTAPDGSFDFTMPLTQSTYYIIGRNVLYLSPGDDMNVDLRDNQTKSSLSGKGSEANSYMKSRPFPKGGSFLRSGAMVKKDFTATRKSIDSLAQLRLEELKQLKNVSDEFLEMETIRIKADVINSYFCFAFYTKQVVDRSNSREEYYQKLHNFYASMADYINPILKELSATDRYLDIPVVRMVLMSANDVPGLVFTKSDRFLEFKKIVDANYEIPKSPSKEDFDKLDAFTKGLKNDDFRDEFGTNIKNLKVSTATSKAIDLMVTTPDGQSKKLSDYKGKAIYIDFWATWCGPCRMESPHFKALSKQYPNILFLSISTDKDVAVWKASVAGNERSENTVDVLSHDPKVNSGWNVSGIPHFVLIDKDFNIVSRSAPRPSESENIIPLLDKLNNVK